MSRWPDFFIVGAARSGTTSLYYYLYEHPDIFMPSVKEPHFFTDIKVERAMRAERGLAPPVGMVQREDEYLRLFKKAKPAQIIGEASVAYLARPAVADRIRAKNPHAKIIAILRQPVDRAHSNYLLGLGGSRGRKSFYEALQEDYDYMTKFSSEWSLYIWRGLYYQQVKHYIDSFGQEQVRIYLYEDLASDATALVKDVCSFLEVPFYDGSFFDPARKYHPSGMPTDAPFKWVGRSRTARFLFSAVVPTQLQVPIRDRIVGSGQPKPPLDPRARDFLRSIYREDILKLQDLIGRDLTHWLADNTAGSGR